MFAGRDARNSALWPAPRPRRAGDSTVARRGCWRPGRHAGRALGRLPGSEEGAEERPDDAVESLEMIVLLMRFTASASCSDTPAPSQPATLLAMMLLVTLTEYQRAGVVGESGRLPRR